jgi:hypothetical protein
MEYYKGALYCIFNVQTIIFHRFLYYIQEKSSLAEKNQLLNLDSKIIQSLVIILCHVKITPVRQRYAKLQKRLANVLNTNNYIKNGAQKHVICVKKNS